MTLDFQDALDPSTEEGKQKNVKDMSMDLDDTVAKVESVVEEGIRKISSQYILQKSQELLEEFKTGTQAERVAKLYAGFSAMKNLIGSQIADDDVRIQCLRALESSVKWQIPNVPMAREIADLCFHTIATQNNDEQIELGERILQKLLRLPQLWPTITALDELTDSFLRNLGNERSDEEGGIKRMRAASTIFDLLFRQPEEAKYLKKLLPKMETFFSKPNTVNDEIQHVVIKVACQTLKICNDLTDAHLDDIETFTRNIFDQIVELLQRADSYDQRANLMMCMALLAGSGHNKHILAEITMGDLLIRLNEEWKHETMMGILIISVFVESLEQLCDPDFTSVADNCLRLHNVYSSTDDYHMRERLIALLYVFSNKLKCVYGSINDSDIATFQDIVTVIFHKAAHEIQAFNMPKEMWADVEFVSFARIALPGLMRIVSNCVSIISLPDDSKKPKTRPEESGIPNGLERREGAKEEETKISPVKVQKERTANAEAFKEENMQTLSTNKRQLTQLEVMEICKCICSIFDAGVAATAIMGDSVVGADKGGLLQVEEIQVLIKMSLGMLVTPLGPGATKQWIKLITPIVFVLGTRNNVAMAFFDSFTKDYAEACMPHMIIFILQLIKNQTTVVEYIKNVTTYSEGVLGLFSLHTWDSCAARLDGETPENLIALTYELSKCIFKGYVEAPGAPLSCENEVLHLATAVSKLCVTKTDPHLKVATTMFKHITKTNQFTTTMAMLRVPIDIIVTKVHQGGANVHPDWLELMMAAVSRGPFTLEIVQMCAKPALCILRDYKWELVPAALDMIHSWAEFQPPEDAYNLLSHVRLYRTSSVEPHFIQCLAQYLQDENLPNFRQNADVVMNIFSMLGSLSMNYVRNLTITQDMPHTIAIPIQMSTGALDNSDATCSAKARLSSVNSSTSDSTDSGEKTTDTSNHMMVDGSDDRTELASDEGNEHPNVIGLGIPVVDGLNSVIRQMSRDKIAYMEFDGAAVFVLNAVSPVMDFSVSLSECAVALARKQADEQQKHEEPTKYYTQESTKEFIYILMHALIKVAAVGMKYFPKSQTFSHINQLMQAIQTYIVIVSKTQANNDIDVTVDPALILQGVAARLLVSREQPLYNFDLPYDKVDPMEVHVATEFIQTVFSKAIDMGCNNICTAIIAMLCLGCNSHDASEKGGACIALGKICRDHPSFIQPTVLEVANSVAQLCDGIAMDGAIMLETLEALLTVDEPVIIKWAISLLEHPLWYLRATGQMCLKAVKDKSELKKQLKGIMSEAHNLQTPDVQIFLATMENGDISLLEPAISNIEPLLQSIAEAGDADKASKDQADALVDWLGQLLINQEYADAAAEMEETFKTILVWLLKLVIVGGCHIANKAKAILKSSKNCSVDSKTLSMALEEYIFQLQTIFDERLLDKILEVVRKYSHVVDSALRESLFNVTKALLEGTLNSSIHDEYQNAHVIDYMVFIANMGARRSCTDVIFKQWFTTVDCVEKGILIPGSVAYGIWQVISYEGVIHNVFNNTMKHEYLSLFYFAHGKADVDYILWKALLSLESENELEKISYAGLIHWLCKDNLSQTMNVKHFKKLTDVMIKIAFEENTQLDDLLAPPFKLDTNKVLHWKVAYICAAVLLKIRPIPNLVEKLVNKPLSRDQSGEATKLNKFLANAFIQRYNSNKCGSTYNPIIGGNIFDMQNYQLKHLLPMINDEMCTKEDGLLEDLVDFCWQSSTECDALGKLLAVACLVKVVETNNTPTLGVAAVLKKFIDVITNPEVTVFLRMHHTINLDSVAMDNNGSYTLMELLEQCARTLVKTLRGIFTIPEETKGAKDINTVSSRIELWKWMVISKIKDLGDDPKLLVPLMSLFVWYLHEDVTMFQDILADILRVIYNDIGSMHCNIIQSGTFDAFFGVLALIDKNQLDIDLPWIPEACLDIIATYINKDNLDDERLCSYIPLVVKIMCNTSRFELFACKLKEFHSIPTYELICDHFNQTHLSNNSSYCLNMSCSNLNRGLVTALQDTGYINSRNCYSERHCQWLNAVAVVILRILDQMMDQVEPNSDDITHITELYDTVWHLETLAVANDLQSSLYKLCSLFASEFAEVNATDIEQDTEVVMDNMEDEYILNSEPRKNTTVKDCGITDRYTHPFSKWLLTKIVTELRLVANDDQPGPVEYSQMISTTQGQEAAEMGKHGSHTNTSQTYIVSPEPIMVNDWIYGERLFSPSELRSNFSNAIRSIITILKALQNSANILHSFIKSIIPEVVEALHRIVVHVNAIRRLDNTHVVSCLTLIPLLFGITPDDTDHYNQDERQNLEQILTLAMWSLAILDINIRHQVYDLLASFTQYLTLRCSQKVLNLATEIVAIRDPDAMNLDESKSENPDTLGSGEARKPRGVGNDKSKGDKNSRNTDRKITKPEDTQSKDTAKHNKRPKKETGEAYTSYGNDIDLDIYKIQFCIFECSSTENVKFAEYKNWIKGTPKSYPKQLLEYGDNRDVETTFEDLVSLEQKSVYIPVEFSEMLQKLKFVYGQSDNKDELDLELVYAIRNVVYHGSLADAYYKLMFNCLDRPYCVGLAIRNQSIAFIASRSSCCSKFMDIFEELTIPCDVYSILMYIFSSEISQNKDREFYLPLYLDLIITLCIDHWDLSFSEQYPVLPTLMPKNVNKHISQIDLICQDESQHTFKKTVMLLRDFRNMARESDKQYISCQQKEDLAFEITPKEFDMVNPVLKTIYQYYDTYFGTYALSSKFKTCLRNMWHSDREFAGKVWAAILPQMYNTFTGFQQEKMGTAICQYLAREKHLYNRGITCKPILHGVINCYPPVNLPPELMKYLAVILGVWDEVLYHLEKQLLSQPLDITRIATVLSDLYERLGMDDMTIGAYRTWVITQETRLAICYLQHSKWRQAQREFNSIMDSLALTGQTAEAVSSFDESKIWYNGWIYASKQLGEWDILRDVSFVAGDHNLFTKACNALQDWGEVLPGDGLHNARKIFALDDAECKIDKVYQQIQTDLLPLKDSGNDLSSIFLINASNNVQKVINAGKNDILSSWLILPKGLSEAHRAPMRLHQRFVEVEEGMNYLTDVMQAIENGTVPQSASIIAKWRQRLPSPRDVPSIWHEMLAWRAFMYSTMRFALANSPAVPNQERLQAILNLQDLQWTYTRFATVTRKHHQLPVVSSVMLNKAQMYHRLVMGQSTVVTEDCLVMMIERIKQYLTIPINILDMLKGLVNIDLELVPSSGCETLKSHIIRLVAEAISLKASYEMPKRPAAAENELSSNLMLEALKLEPMLPKNWLSWAKYNDKRIDHPAVVQLKPGEASFPSDMYESAIMGYLMAVSIRPHNHWILIGRIFTLMNELRLASQLSSCSETFKTYSERVPPAIWYMWLPQLISGLNKNDGGEIQHVLQLLMSKLPQQVFYSLRCEYFAQTSAGDPESGADTTQPSTMKKLLSALISSNPNVGTMLESFAATVTHLGRPDFIDEILSATETVFEECLDLPFNENILPQMFNCLAMKMPHRSSIMNESAEADSPIVEMMKDFEKDFSEAGSNLNCGETMNLLLKWMSKLNEVSKTSTTEILKQRMNNMKVNQFCQHLQMLNMELQLPTLQPSPSLLNPKQRQCLGECRTIVAILPEVKKRKLGRQIVKSISILAQNGQVYVYTVQPLALLRQKSDQHVSQMINLFNHYALKYNETVRRNITIPSVNIVSLDPYLCLYEEEVHNETLSQVMCQAVSYENLVNERPDYKTMMHMHPAVHHETNTLLLVLHKMLMETGVTQQLVQRWQKFNPECTENLSFIRVYQLFKDKQYPWFATWYKKIHQDVLMEAYSEICALIPDDILFNYGMKKFDSYQDFMALRRMFTTSYSVQALFGLMFVTPYATPCKLSFNFNNGQVKQLDFRLNYSREIFVDYSKLRVFRFTRNIKTMIGPVCRMGIMPAVMYSLCAAFHAFKIDILGALSAILSDDHNLLQSATNSPHYKPDVQVNHANKQSANSGSMPSTPGIPPNREIILLEEYLGRVLNYCSYLRSPTDQDQCNMPINNIITCIIDASADSSTLGKLKTSYQPWF
ncbi:transformation transcription domain-associated protein [Babesia ovis]|uniref:Transformation transcription domain-associated protein n=1 Tax=Babesia ovis TaxID=5869 RepID=A0A9W5WUM3_BABOV|nr:transformation transcription domain-associated protein [Babesia ovis]